MILFLLLFICYIERATASKSCKSHVCPLDHLHFVEPLQGDRIAGPDVDVHLALSNYEQGKTVCVKLNDDDPTCVKKIDSPTLEARLVVSPGNHTLQAWVIRKENEKEHFTEISFETLVVTKPWWGPYRKPANFKSLYIAAEEESGLEKSTNSVGDLELLPHYLGPFSSGALAQTKKALIALFAGVSSMQQADAKVRQFGFENFSFVLFLYDLTPFDFEAYPWGTRIPIIRASKQMKWYFLKRFFSPEITAYYEYVFVIDDDCDTTDFDPLGFVNDMKRYDVQIGQPSHIAGSHQPQYPFLIQKKNNRENGHRTSLVWTTFIESGPFVAFSNDAWKCVWRILQPDLVSGYGYDLLWCSACGKDKSGVLHKYAIKHENKGTASSKRVNWVQREVAEAFTLFERLKKYEIFPEDPKVLAEVIE
eukprot:g6134.t1